MNQLFGKVRKIQMFPEMGRLGCGLRCSALRSGKFGPRGILYIDVTEVFPPHWILVNFLFFSFKYSFYC